MYYKKTYRILTNEYSISLQKFLIERKIYFELSYCGHVNSFLIFLNSDNPLSQELDSFIQNEMHHNLGLEYSLDASCETTWLHHDAIYSPEEIERGEWFWVRSVNKKSMFRRTENTVNRTCIYTSKKGKTRYRHITQAEPFEIPSTFNFGNGKHFMATNFIDTDDLFCNNFAKKIIEENGLNGFRFDAVLDKRSKKPLDDIHQVRSSFILPDGCVTAPVYGSYTCPDCGMTVLGNVRGEGPYDREVFPCHKEDFDPSVDFYETLPIFELGFGARIRFLISKRAYEVFRKNKIDRALEFVPVQWVD